jgi:hypothetical protein
MGCSGYITGDDWKFSELKKKYDGWFSWHLQEKTNWLKKKA